MLTFPRNVLDLTTQTPLADIAAAREDVADATACGELDPGHRDLYLEHLDMIEAATRAAFTLI